jgi:hypothetical protein
VTRRPFIALTIAFCAVVVATVAFVDHRSTIRIEPKVGDGNQAPPALNESTVVAPQGSNGDHKNARRDDSQAPAVTEAPREYSAADEAISGIEIRAEVTRDVHGIYSLLIGDLHLSSSQQDALLSFLIEDEISRTRTSYSSGIGMDEQERSAKIAAIIGEANLQQFLAREQSIDEYREAYYVQTMLEQKGAPLTDRQHDELVKILIDVRERLDMKVPAHIQPDSIESLENTLHRLDEYERLALELTPSVLSAKQVEYMFERYQALSYRRADALELHKQRRAANPDDDQLLWYPSRRN